MTMPTPELIEYTLWTHLANLDKDERLSPSHDKWHIETVLKYAQQLAGIYGADLTVLTAAVMLHDLGRSDSTLRSVESTRESVRRAREILEGLDLFSTEQIHQILTIIDEHDQPELTPSTLEGRILKDADFMAGFGARGILRIAMWAAESGEGVDHVLERLNVKMPKRVEGLEFPESRQVAYKEMGLARLFTALLMQEPKLNLRNGAYVVIEGISGSGKDTQALRLSARLKAAHKLHLILNEPTVRYKQMMGEWRSDRESARLDPWLQTFLLMADRYAQVHDKVQTALERGEVVISVRGYQSTIIYQGYKIGAWGRELIELVHLAFVPSPDVVFILDVPHEVAYERCYRRNQQIHNSRLGEQETPEALKTFRAEYLNLAATHAAEGYVVIDANRPAEVVEEEIWTHLISNELL